MIKNDNSSKKRLDKLATRKAIEASLEEQKKFAEGLIENSAVATFVLDAEHKVVFWNKACEALTGVSAAEVIGTDNQWRPFYSSQRQTLSDVVIDGNFADLPALYKKYSQSKLLANALQSEGWYPQLNGKSRYIIFDAAPIFDSKDELGLCNRDPAGHYGPEAL